MSEIRTLRATCPEDLLALVPTLLGFHPEESVVLLTIGAATHPFHARVDLPRGSDVVAELATYLADVAARNGVRRVAVVVYGGDPGQARSMVDALDVELIASGTELVCAVRSDGLRWWALSAVGETGGARYDVDGHPVTARAVVDGTVVLRSRRELADSLVGTDLEEADELTRLVASEVARLAEAVAQPGGGTPTREKEGDWVLATLRRFLADRLRLPGAEVARLATSTTVSPAVRDRALAAIEQDSARGHVDLWRDVVRRVPLDVQAAPATLLGFAAWLSGDGALAWCAVERAWAADPGYGLAERLATLLEGAVPPSTWPGSGP
jgi:hypothetical protein